MRKMSPRAEASAGGTSWPWEIWATVARTTTATAMPIAEELNPCFMPMLRTIFIPPFRQSGTGGGRATPARKVQRFIIL